jgi:hypothetical protein
VKLHELPPPPVNLRKGKRMSPIASTRSTDFNTDTAPYFPDRSLTEAAGQTVTLTLMVEGLGAISDYSLRLDIPAFDDHLRTVADVIYAVHAAAFAMNWSGPPPEEEST